jgi:hypothetical protein
MQRFLSCYCTPTVWRLVLSTLAGAREVSSSHPNDGTKITLDWTIRQLLFALGAEAAIEFLLEENPSW